MANTFTPSPWILTALGVIALLSSIMYGMSVYLKSQKEITVPQYPEIQGPGVVFTPKSELGAEYDQRMAQTHASGEVYTINAAKRTLGIIDGSDLYAIVISGATTISRDGETVTFRDIVIGDHVSVESTAPFVEFSIEAKTVRVFKDNYQPSASVRL